MLRAAAATALAAWTLAACSPAPDAWNGAERTFAARDSGEVNSEPACVYCFIAFDTVVTLGSSQDPGGIGGAGFTPWTVDGRGRYFAQVQNHEVFVYAPDGTFMRSLAPLGEGPGELPRDHLMLSVGAGDTLRVVGGFPGAIHVFAPDLTFVRRVPMAAGVGEVAMATYHPATGAFLVPDFGRSRDALKLVGPGGEVVRTLATKPGDGRIHLLAVNAPDGTIWTLPSHGWQLDNWSTEGVRLRSFHATMPWSTAPDNGFIGMSFDSEGRAYLFAIDRSGMVVDPRSGAISRADSEYSFIVEVLDLASGTLLARRQLSQLVSAAPVGAGAFTVAESVSGNLRIQILRPRFVEE